ncbi:MAG TPA: histidine phosphatase family protein [Candidatus Woesebacteria bacterium]|nr:histidine phosphatase family protein [Candidatus Woesebacteria bacterium]
MHREHERCKTNENDIVLGRDIICLIRHGQTNWNAEKRLMGLTDIPINKNGAEQVKSLGKKISQLKISHIFSSDLLRAKETAEIINNFVNVDISLDNRLRELNYGDIEGKVLKEISSEDWNRFNLYPEQINAESFENVYARVKNFFEDLAKRNILNVIIITHGGTLRMMLYYAKNKDHFVKEDYIKNYLNLKIENASIIEMER